MKTKEELDTLKEKVETLSKKLHELSEEDLEQVTSGAPIGLPVVAPVLLKLLDAYN